MVNTRRALQGLTVYLSPVYKVADTPSDIKIIRSGSVYTLYGLVCQSLTGGEKGEKNRLEKRKKVCLCLTVSQEEVRSQVKSVNHYPTAPVLYLRCICECVEEAVSVRGRQLQAYCMTLKLDFSLLQTFL